MPLTSFSKDTQRWFTNSFAEPTTAQAKAWPQIAAGHNVLLSAPTGSGKTLAAFLSGIDRIASNPAAEGESGVRLLYISPLKALSYDIDRNLRAPLRGIGAEISVGVRTGDTPQRDRQQMLRKPPEILITTPESLYLMLTSRAREILRSCETVIVDEIHAVAATKRGAHLALTLERLEQEAGRPIQRIGLSATQNPLEEIGRFLVGPNRECEIVDAGVAKQLDLKIHVPVESMVEPGEIDGAENLDPLQGGEATRRSIWPAIYPKILELVKEHRSTIVFVNNRATAERLALRLNDLAAQDEEITDPEVARSHHGSLAHEERTVVEELLKAGQLRCLIATSSLELGIDMGAVDLVLQVESPKSVSRGLQRIGRAGHNVGDVSKGRIFPKFRGDLLECAVVAARMRKGEIEPTVVPRNPIDVLAQHLVAAIAIEDRTADELFELVRGSYSFSDLSREIYDGVLDMLDGRYPSEEFAELRPRIVWDRISGELTARKGALKLAVTNAGTIPDRGLFRVTLPDGRRVGELDEEMVYEARAGQVFLLGSSSWRIEEIGRDSVTVTPAPGVPAAVPFWKGDGLGRPRELGEAIGAFARTAIDTTSGQLSKEFDLDKLAAENLLDYLADQQTATGVIPSDRTLVVERFRDEIGDWRICLLSPFGGRVHAAWSLAVSARIREQLGLESDAIYSDDGIIVHLPDVDEPPDAAELFMFEADEIEEIIVPELASSALFGSRFREAASRALLIPRNMPGRRTPLWQQRMKAQSLLEVARRFGEFPIVLETYRECLRDYFDLPGLKSILRQLETREIGLVETETETASPFATALLFDYIATYMYEGDTPNAERRAAALSLDRDLLSELLGQDELRELIDPGALADVEASLQFQLPTKQATGADELEHILRTLGDLAADEIQLRVLADLDTTTLLTKLEDSRRAIRVRVAGEERWIASSDAGLYRDALGVVPPSGLPESFLVDVDSPLQRLVARFARRRGPFTTATANRRFGIETLVALQELEASGELVRGEILPDGSEREWCNAEVLKRLRRASLAALRKEIEPADAAALARFMPSWQGIDRYGPRGSGVDRLREILEPLQGVALPVKSWEGDVLPRRLGAYSPSWLDELCSSGEIVWIGAGAHGKDSGRIALYFRDDVALLGPPNDRADEPNLEVHSELRTMLSTGAHFFTDLLAESDRDPTELREALFDLVWAGEVTNDAFAPLRLGTTQRQSSSRRRRVGTRFGRTDRGSQPPGRWSLTQSLFRNAPDGRERRRATAELLLERYGIVTREHVVSEGISGGFSAVYQELAELETLGKARRGYFIEGLGGAQFALPGAVERLRGLKDRESEDPLVLATNDPAQPYGSVLKWPKRDSQSRGGSRVIGSQTVFIGGEPVLYLGRSGRSLRTFVELDDLRVVAALDALVEAVEKGTLKRIALEKVNGEPITESPLKPLLTTAGFRTDPRRMTLSA